jgi:hypothetical protein
MTLTVVLHMTLTTQLPDIGQLKVLASVLGFDAKDFYTHPTIP